MNYEPITIISAELSHLDFNSNYSRTTELRTALLNLGLSFVGVSQVQNGTELQSFIITTDFTSELLELAKKLGQKSVLFSDNQRLTTEHFTDGSATVTKGKLKVTDKSPTVIKNCLIVKEQGREFFYITEEG